MENLTQSTVEQILEQNLPELLPPESAGPKPASRTVFSEENMIVWTWLVSKGISNALSGLSQMVGHEIKVNSLDLKWLPAKDAADLLGGPEAVSVGIYLRIEGDATGHLLLMHEPKIAFQLIDLQLGQPLGSTKKIGEIERSILGEMGNITGSYFLNTLADTANLVLMPSPPAVIVDMVRAIMSIPLTFIMEEQDDALVVNATFSTANQQIDGRFMVLPTMDFMRAVMKHPLT